MAARYKNCLGNKYNEEFRTQNSDPILFCLVVSVAFDSQEWVQLNYGSSVLRLVEEMYFGDGGFSHAIVWRNI